MSGSSTLLATDEMQDKSSESDMDWEISQTNLDKDGNLENIENVGENQLFEDSEEKKRTSSLKELSKDSKRIALESQCSRNRVALDISFENRPSTSYEVTMTQNEQYEPQSLIETHSKEDGLSENDQNLELRAKYLVSVVQNEKPEASSSPRLTEKKNVQYSSCIYPARYIIPRQSRRPITVQELMAALKNVKDLEGRLLKMHNYQSPVEREVLASNASPQDGRSKSMLSEYIPGEGVLKGFDYSTFFLASGEGDSYSTKTAESVSQSIQGSSDPVPHMKEDQLHPNDPQTLSAAESAMYPFNKQSKDGSVSFKEIRTPESQLQPKSATSVGGIGAVHDVEMQLSDSFEKKNLSEKKAGQSDFTLGESDLTLTSHSRNYDCVSKTVPIPSSEPLSFDGRPKEISPQKLHETDHNVHAEKLDHAAEASNRLQVLYLDSNLSDRENLNQIERIVSELDKLQMKGINLRRLRIEGLKVPVCCLKGIEVAIEKQHCVQFFQWSSLEKQYTVVQTQRDSRIESNYMQLQNESLNADISKEESFLLENTNCYKTIIPSLNVQQHSTPIPRYLQEMTSHSEQGIMLSNNSISCLAQDSSDVAQSHLAVDPSIVSRSLFLADPSGPIQPHSSIDPSISIQNLLPAEPLNTKEMDTLIPQSGSTHYQSVDTNPDVSQYQLTLPCDYVGDHYPEEVQRHLATLRYINAQPQFFVQYPGAAQPHFFEQYSGYAQPHFSVHSPGAAQPHFSVHSPGAAQPHFSVHSPGAAQPHFSVHSPGAAQPHLSVHSPGAAQPQLSVHSPGFAHSHLVEHPVVATYFEGIHPSNVVQSDPALHPFQDSSQYNLTVAMSLSDIEQPQLFMPQQNYGQYLYGSGDGFTTQPPYYAYRPSSALMSAPVVSTLQYHGLSNIPPQSLPIQPLNHQPLNQSNPSDMTHGARNSDPVADQLTNTRDNFPRNYSPLYQSVEYFDTFKDFAQNGSNEEREEQETECEARVKKDINRLLNEESLTSKNIFEIGREAKRFSIAEKLQRNGRETFLPIFRLCSSAPVKQHKRIFTDRKFLSLPNSFNCLDSREIILATEYRKSKRSSIDTAHSPDVRRDASSQNILGEVRETIHCLIRYLSLHCSQINDVDHLSVFHQVVNLSAYNFSEEGISTLNAMQINEFTNFQRLVLGAAFRSYHHQIIAIFSKPCGKTFTFLLASMKVIDVRIKCTQVIIECPDKPSVLSVYQSTKVLTNNFKGMTVGIGKENLSAISENGKEHILICTSTAVKEMQRINFDSSSIRMFIIDDVHRMRDNTDFDMNSDFVSLLPQQTIVMLFAFHPVLTDGESLQKYFCIVPDATLLRLSQHNMIDSRPIVCATMESKILFLLCLRLMLDKWKMKMVVLMTSEQLQNFTPILSPYSCFVTETQSEDEIRTFFVSSTRNVLITTLPTPHLVIGHVHVIVIYHSFAMNSDKCNYWNEVSSIHNIIEGPGVVFDVFDSEEQRDTLLSCQHSEMGEDLGIFEKVFTT